MLNQTTLAVEPLLVDLREQVQRLIADLRRLVYALRPPALDQLGFIGALREQASQYEQKDLSIRVHASEPLPSLPAAVEVAAYRIMQEALTNVVRHARASACQVHLSFETQLELVIEDDGIGVPEVLRAGVGLMSMRERAEELGGQVLIESRPTGGTRVVARLPFGEAPR